MTALSEARSELASLLEKQKALIDSAQPAIKAHDAAQAAEARREKAALRVTLATWLANTYGFTSLDAIKPEHFGLAKAVEGYTKPKAVTEQLREAIASSAIKVNIGWGASYTAKGLVQRLRTPRPEDMRAVSRAEAGVRRAEAALAKAKQARVAAYTAAFENGSRWSLDEIVEAVTKRGVAMVNVERNRKPQELWEAERMGGGKDDDRYSAIGAVRFHVAHLAEKRDDASCIRCQRIATEKAEAESRRAIITALPRRKMNCPDHGKRIGYAGRAKNLWIKHTDGTERQMADCPVLYCPIDLRRYIDGPTLAAEDAKAAKAAAKAAAKTKPPRLVAFICPSCDELIEDAPVQTAGDGTKYVACDYCEAEFNLASVKLATRKAA